MSKRPGLPVAVRQELDKHKAIGVSRYLEKAAARREGNTSWSVSTGRIHSDSTLEAYKRHATAYALWARERYGVRRIEHLHARAGELVSEYVQERIATGHSPFTVQLVRSALRMLHQDWTLAGEVKIPRRYREEITRSRYKAERDKGINQANYQPLIDFLVATGLRRREIEGLVVSRVREEAGYLQVHVDNGKGGKQRDVPVLPGHEEAVRQAIRSKGLDELVFERVPSRIDVHSYRREYAQQLYRHLSGRELPPKHGRLQASDYDEAAALGVSRALGHNRVDVVLTNYIRYSHLQGN